MVSFFNITYISRHSFGNWEHDMHSLHVYMYYIIMYSAYNPKENPREPFIWSIVVWHVDLNIFHGRYEYDSFTKIQELYLTTNNMKNQETFIY